MRRGHGSTKVPNVKLRPAKKGANLPRDQDLDATMYEVGGGSARETLRDDAKPFSGMMICCSGVKDKAALLAKARELGATCTNDLTDLTTHLVADAPGSAKHQVALKLGLHICTSDWIIETHKRWLAGEDIDPDEAVSEYLLPPLKSVVICVTRLTDDRARQRLTKSAMRLGAKYQAHMDKAATHLLIGPDDAGSVDSQKLQWVIRTNTKRAEEQSEEPPIHVVWDVWLLTCAATNSRVPEADFEYSDASSRPELPKELEELLKRPPSKKPAKIYVPASNVGTGTGSGTKEVLEKARFKRSAATEAVWNSILSSRNQAPREDDDEVVPPTPMQTRGIATSTPPTSIPPIPAKPLPPAAGEDSATEDEEESSKDRDVPTTSNCVAQKQPVVELPIPSNRGAPPAKVQSGAAGSSMVSRLNSLRGSAFQLGATLSDHNVPASSTRGLARIASNATLAQKLGSSDAVESNEARPPSSAAKVFVGKRIAPIGEACGPMLYAALRAHGAIVIEGSEVSDPKAKSKGVESEGPIALPSEEADYYIVRLASESAKQAIKLDSYSKFRTDCWVEHCIFEDRLCPCEENVTYVPLKIELPVPEAGNIKLHWTGLNNEQETAVKRLVKAIGITTTKSFAKRVNTHLLCPSRSGLKYDKALQWGVVVVDMDWLYEIAREGRISDTDLAQVRLKLEQSTLRVDAADTSRFGETSGIFGVGSTSLFGVTNGLLAPPDSSPHKEPEQMPIDSNEGRGSGSDGVRFKPLLQLKREASVPVLDVQPEDSTTELKNRSVVESDREREREAQRNQLANSLDALLKKHQREDSTHSDQPRKRIRPTMRHKPGEGATAGGTARSRSLTEKVSSLSLSTRVSDPDYVSPLEGIEPANEETLQVHYHDPNQLAAKEGLRRLLDGSSQAPDSDIINVDTQTDPEGSPEPAPVEPKRKRGGAGTRRRGQRRP